MSVYSALDGGRLAQALYARGGRVLTGGFFTSAGAPLYINRPSFASVSDLGACLTRPALQEILFDALPEGTVEAGAGVVGIEEESDRVCVSLSDGRRIEGEILIGADGLRSTVRSWLHGEQEPTYSGMTCWRGTFETPGLQERFGHTWAEYWGRGLRFGWFHVGGSTHAFYAFQNTPPSPRDREQAGESHLAALRERFGGFGAPVPEILEALEGRALYRDDISDREPLGPVWGRGRATLIGDAAHPVHPSIGQGGCMGIEDAYELAAQLSLTSGPLQERLRAFESRRSPRTERVFRTSRQVTWLGQAEGRVSSLLRDTIYRMMPTSVADRQFRWLFDYVPGRDFSI